MAQFKKANKAITFEEAAWITTAFPYQEDNGKNCFNMQAELAKKIANRITLRHFIKLSKRIINLYDEFAKIKDKFDYICLHAYFLYPNDAQIRSMKSSISSQIIQQKVNVRFKITWNHISIEISLPLNLKNPKLAQTLQAIEQETNQFKMALCSIAFCKRFKEHPLLVGKTSYKSKVIDIFSKLVTYNVPNPLNAIYLSNLTEMGELIGSIQPHTYDSYSNYLVNQV